MGTGKPRADAADPWAGYVALVRRRFRFLERHGYAPPEVWTAMRECTIVYKAGGRAVVSVFDDHGSEPFVQLAPLDRVTASGSTRTFGLSEAVPVLARAFAPPPGARRDIDGWITWYARFLDAHLDAVTRPSSALLDAIEARRPPSDCCA